jgi:hypothetical protein
MDVLASNLGQDICHLGSSVLPGKCWDSASIKPLSLPSKSLPVHHSSIKVKVTLRLAVYRQSVRLGAKPLEAQDQRFFYPNELMR